MTYYSLKQSVKMFITKLIGKYFPISFARSGDDLQVYKLLNNASPGVYLDIGSWHPIKASNTYFFYLRNWKGICVDPNPELKPLFKKHRPNDIFINAGIGPSDSNLNYYMFQNSSMNTFSDAFIHANHLQDKIKKTIKVPLLSIKEILDERLQPHDRLDFFDIDVEGLDLQVLQTNDWEKYRPKVILIESDLSLKDDIISEITSYLQSKNYKFIGKTIISNDLGNLIFIPN